MARVLEASPMMAQSAIWHETRVLHHLSVEPGSYTEVRTQAARILQAAAAAEMGKWEEALDALKGVE